MIRKDFNDLIFRTEKEKNDAIIEKIIERNKLGQPILVFTSSTVSYTHLTLPTICSV